jgi:hypothetical protein
MGALTPDSYGSSVRPKLLAVWRTARFSVASLPVNVPLT